MRISKYFTYDELTISETAERKGIQNVPDDECLANLTLLAERLDQVRELLGHAIIITSGFRSIQVNKWVGGAKTSQHVKGQAADLICPRFGSPYEVCKALIDSGIEFDQLILEYGRWTHFSVSPNPRRQVLSIYSGTGYMGGLQHN